MKWNMYIYIYQIEIFKLNRNQIIIENNEDDDDDEFNNCSFIKII